MLAFLSLTHRLARGDDDAETVKLLTYIFEHKGGEPAWNRSPATAMSCRIIAAEEICKPNSISAPQKIKPSRRPNRLRLIAKSMSFSTSSPPTPIRPSRWSSRAKRNQPHAASSQTIHARLRHRGRPRQRPPRPSHAAKRSCLAMRPLRRKPRQSNRIWRIRGQRRPQHLGIPGHPGRSQIPHRPRRRSDQTRNQSTGTESRRQIHERTNRPIQIGQTITKG